MDKSERREIIGRMARHEEALRKAQRRRTALEVLALAAILTGALIAISVLVGCGSVLQRPPAAPSPKPDGWTGWCLGIVDGAPSWVPCVAPTVPPSVPPSVPPTPVPAVTPTPKPTAEPTVPPVTKAQSFPQGLPDSAYVGQQGETGAPTAGLFRSAIASVIQRRGLHCEGDACDKVPATCQMFGLEIGAELRSRGVSASLYNESWINCDQVYVCRPPETDPRVCLWDCWEFGSDAWDGKVGCGVRWPVAGGASYCGTYRISGTIPSQPPTPIPTADSTADYGCPAPRPERAFTAETLPQGWGGNEIGRPRWVIDSSPHGEWIDTTIQTRRNLPFCQSIGMGDGPPTPYPPRDACPMRPDGHPERMACERYISEGGLVTVAKGGATCEINAGNPAQFKRTSPGGTCQLCSPESYTHNPYDTDPLTTLRVCSAAW